MAAASLVVRVSAQIAEFQKSFDEMNRTTKKFAGDFEGIATRAAAVGSFIGNIAAGIARSIANNLGDAIRSAIKFSSEFSNAFIGLGSVARAFGTDTGLATDAARRLASDGLLPVKDAATGLKNLLAAGFSLPQATKLMEAFKDSAAFGRQGALSFGDAVRSATEGVKNGNSILVDNAGITKNLSQILKEAGFSATDLSRASSDAGVRMALFNGILREAAAQSGDAARLTQTYSGQVARLESQYQTLLASLGNAITQNATIARAIAAVGDAFAGLTQRMVANKQGLHLVSEAVILLVRGMSHLVNIVDLVQTAFSGLQQFTNTLFTGVASVARAFFDLSIRANQVTRVLDPLNWDRYTRAIDAARDGLTFVTGAIDGFKAASVASQQRSNDWGNALQEVRANLDNLGRDLEGTRGKTVELGTAGVKSGDEFGRGVEAGSTRATKGLNAVSAAIAQVKVGLTSLPGTAIGQPFKGAPPVIPSTATGIGLGIGGSLPGFQFPIPQIPGEVRQKFFTSIFGTANEFGASLANVIQGAFQGGGNVLNSVGSLIGSQLTTGIAKMITSTGGLAISGALGAAINAILPGLGSLLGPLASKIGSVFAGMFDRDKGRDLVESFAESLGGFDSLRTKLNELGAEGDALWIRLTQGVGRNNPEQARAAIESVTAALEAHRAKQAETATAAEQATATQIAAYQKVSDALTSRIAELSSEYDRLNESIQDEKPEEIMGEIERLTRERMAAIAEERRTTEVQLAQATKEAADTFGQVTDAAELSAKEIEELFKNIRIEPIKVPIEYEYPSGGLNTGGGGEFASGGGSAALDGREQTIIVNMDGQTIARQTVRHMPAVLELYGI